MSRLGFSAMLGPLSIPRGICGGSQTTRGPLLDLPISKYKHMYHNVSMLNSTMQETSEALVLNRVSIELPISTLVKRVSLKQPCNK